MLDDAVTVPIGWLFAVGGALILAVWWWLRAEFERNWRDHDDIERKVEVHHKKIDNHLDRIHNRIDWILQHGGYPKYPEERDHGN